VKRYKFLIVFPFLLLIVGARKASAQQAGMERSMQSSLKNTFSYQITSSIGTQTSANVSGNILADTQAILNLKSGGKITNKIGDASGNASAVFDARPNGSSVNLQGITGENIFLIDDGTSFKSSLKSDESINSSNSTGQASAMAIQSTSVKVESGTSSFISSFQKAF
jgi:hypothetical protein